ncbi:MAG: phosphogluconate dehydrogenase (NAD(+)-dependent, decarboxylating) [Candidatus Levyibacteriota bacterium]
MQIAILGLGKMGSDLAQKLLAGGHHVLVWNRSRDTLEQFRNEHSEYIVKQQLEITHSLEDLRDKLQPPRVIWLMLPSGDPTERILSEIKDGIAEHGDIIIDGGNSNYKDTERRSKECKALSLQYLGIGVSGGVHGLENGYPMMVGGDKLAYDYISAILDTLAKPNGGHTYFGEGGAGHFVKMVHNGVEYGMMQAIAEGIGVLAKSPYRFSLVSVGNNWQRGSIVSSFLMWAAISALIKDPTLAQFDGYIDAKGEGEWTVQAAKELDVPIPVIEKSLEFRKRSQYDKGIQETFVAKMVAALRHEFGGHEIHKIEMDEPPKTS